MDGAPGGSSFGGAVCLLGGGLLQDCIFSGDTATGGTGGDGGSGTFSGGNGGDGGAAVGGCLYNYGRASVDNCSFADCVTVGGASGVAGSGPFTGRNGRLSLSGTNISPGIVAAKNILAEGSSASAYLAVTGPGNNPAPDNSLATAAASSGGAPAQSEPSAKNGEPMNLAALQPGISARTNLAPGAGSPATAPLGGPPSPPVPGSRPTGLPGKAFVPLKPASGTAPSHTSTNALAALREAARSPLEEPLPEGMIDFRGADLNQVLDIYSMMVNRTLLRPGQPAGTDHHPDDAGPSDDGRGHPGPGSGAGAQWHHHGEHGRQVREGGARGAERVGAGARFNTNSAAQLPDLGQYMTHVVQLKYAKPSELVPVLTPFVKIPNAMLPLDANQILVLRDYAENVKRMLEMIKEIDVAVPSEYVQEVIPIKYAQAIGYCRRVEQPESRRWRPRRLGAAGGAGALAAARTTGGTRRHGTGGRLSAGRNHAPGWTTPRDGSRRWPGPPRRPRGGARAAPSPSGCRTSSTAPRPPGDSGPRPDQDHRGRAHQLAAHLRSKEDMKTIKDIVAKLDVVLAQVLIEAAIISVTLNDSRDLGFSYLQHPQNVGPWTGVGALNNNTILSPGSFSNGDAPTGYPAAASAT